MSHVTRDTWPVTSEILLKGSIHTKINHVRWAMLRKV